MESMKQKFFRAAVPLVMLAVSAALSVFVYRLPQPVRDPLPVLMYHHMVPDGQDCNDMTVTPGKFRADSGDHSGQGLYAGAAQGVGRWGRPAGKAHPHHL